MVNIIPIITGNSCKAGMAYLNKLSFRKLSRVIFTVIESTITGSANGGRFINLLEGATAIIQDCTVSGFDSRYDDDVIAQGELKIFQKKREDVMMMLLFRES